jgi:hypothetical protein
MIFFNWENKIFRIKKYINLFLIRLIYKLKYLNHSYFLFIKIIIKKILYFSPKIKK